jgi:hypothetical protein
VDFGALPVCYCLIIALSRYTGWKAPGRCFFLFSFWKMTVIPFTFEMEMLFSQDSALYQVSLLLVSSASDLIISCVSCLSSDYCISGYLVNLVRAKDFPERKVEPFIHSKRSPATRSRIGHKTRDIACLPI